MKSEFGRTFKVTISGGSHEPEMTVEMTGLPVGFTVDMKKVSDFLKRRSPGEENYTTARQEKDIPLLKNGTEELEVDEVIVPADGKLCFVVKNSNTDKTAYENMLPRPGHADLPAYLKYKGKVDMSGGGPFSGRMTVMLCIAGAIALQYLQQRNIKISSRVLSIGQASGPQTDLVEPKAIPMTDYMLEEMEFAKNDNNSVGGVVEAFATGLPLGLGGPMYDGMESILSPIAFGIPAVKGVEFGNGFASSYLLGSENNDDFLAITKDERIITATNNHGGILGGLTTGMPLVMRVAFKPAPSIGKKQSTVDPVTGKPEDIQIQGRHDACFVPRAAAVVEAALAVGLMDAILSDKTLQKDRNISDMRDDIDRIDAEIASLLNKRMELSGEIAKYKMNHDIPVLDTGREAQVLSKVDPDLKDIYIKIMEKSKEKQKMILEENMLNSGKEAEGK